MAQYRHLEDVAQFNSPAFDYVLEAGEEAPNAGIYKCESCGLEIASSRGDPLPSRDHHQHSPGAARIRWRMIVFAGGK